MAYSKKKIIVCGIGNLLLRDEGVGIHVINELQKLSLPKNVEVRDCATRGMDALDELEGTDKAIIVDAVKLGDKPGTVYRFTLDELERDDRTLRMMSFHDLDLLTAIKIGRSTYDLPEDVVIIGIEPERANEYSMELTPEVAKAVPKAVQAVLSEIKKSE